MAVNFVIKIANTLCLKKPDTYDIFKYLQHSWTNINNFWYIESLINMLCNDAYHFAICCKTENQLKFSVGNPSSGWRTIIF